MTAAADPLFYAHHANLDRLWILWAAQTEENAGPAGWETRSLSFIDECGRTAKVSIGQLIQDQLWGYKYGPLGHSDPLYPARGPSAIESIPTRIPVTGSAGRFETQKLLKALQEPAKNLDNICPFSFQLIARIPEPGYFSLGCQVLGVTIPLATFGVFSDESHPGVTAISAPLSARNLRELFWPGGDHDVWSRVAHWWHDLKFEPTLTIGFCYKNNDQTKDQNWKPLPLQSAEVHYRVFS